jgi:long-chain fatty acid transport protein
MPLRSAYALALACALLALYAAPARAQCGGLCLYETGTPDSGRSAAGANARAEDASTVLWNPAGMTRLEGVHMHLGTVLAIIDTKFHNGPGTTSLGNDGGDLNSFLPLAGAYVALNPIEKLRAGIAFTADYGGAVNYSSNWVGRSFVTEAELLALNFALQFGYPVTDWLSVGAGVNFTYALFDMKFRTSTDNGAPTIEISEADDWAPSANVGLLFTPREDTRIGINYRSQTSLNLSGDFDIPVAVPPFDLNFEAEMNFPQGVNVGVFHQLTDEIDLFADAGWSDWSAFSYQPATVGPITVPIDRGWNDTWRVAAGARFRPLPKWILNTGFSWDSSPVSDDKRLPDIPVGGQFRFSVGSEHPVAKNITLGIAYTLIYSPDLKVDNIPLPPGGDPILDGDYDPTYMHFVTLNVSLRFGGPDT